jgi:hypothetical protein
MAVGPSYARGYGRNNPSNNEWEVVSKDIFERDVKSPDKGKKKAESRKVINTNPVPGKTRIGNLARGGGAVGGGWMDQIR